DTLTALLAILKAGAAYLPLEPAFPEQRLRFMLEEAGSPLILTQEALIDRLPSGCGRPLTFEALTPRLAEPPDTPVGRRASPEQLAYGIYTTGSKGRPDGAILGHRGA